MIKATTKKNRPHAIAKHLSFEYEVGDHVLVGYKDGYSRHGVIVFAASLFAGNHAQDRYADMCCDLSQDGRMVLYRIEWNCDDFDSWVQESEVEGLFPHDVHTKEGSPDE